tara:strand:- start:2060 stop:2749 length:690 start_codon:yes stop_codon:yes gene_type:complete
MKLSSIKRASIKLPRLITSSLCLLSISQFSSALPQYINEFHYDNSGADQTEYVEIAGLAGSDLNGWYLDFYNGANGKIYSSWALSGVIDDEVAGFGALSFSGSSGLQNGPNDGIALVDNLGKWVQFISYEGTVTGAEGSVLGLTSTDIKVTEGGSTPLGYSLQLRGVGTDSEDFTWTSGLSSFGELNVAQSYQQATPSVSVQSVDEPGQLGLMSLALLGLCLGCRKNKR